MLGSIVAAPFLLFALLILIVPISLWYAFAASVLWGWFIVPFFQAPELSLWQMWAVALTLGVMRPKFNIHKETREIDWPMAGFVLFGPALSLGLGAIVKFWILP